MPIATASVPSVWDQVSKEFECDCSNKQVVYWMSGGHRCYGRQCTNCGKNGSVPKTSVSFAEKESAVPLDKSINQRHYEQRAARAEELRQEQRDQENADWLERYEAYLTTPAWRERRRLVLERAEGRCEGCGRHAATEVHHLTYEHVGNEFLWELVAICRDCHKRVHGRDS